MKRKDLIKIIAALGDDNSGVLIEKPNDDIQRITNEKIESVTYDYHIVSNIKLVNNSIVICISDKGI